MVALATFSKTADEDKLKAEFGEHLDFGHEEDEPESEVLWLWDELKPQYDIFSIAQLYALEHGQTLDGSLIMGMAKEVDLPITDTLKCVHAIWSGFVEVRRQYQAGEQNAQ